MFSPESGPTPGPPPTRRLPSALCRGAPGSARFLSFEFKHFHGVTPVVVHRKRSVAAGSQHPILRVHKSTVGHDRAHILSGNENAGIRRLRDTGTGCRPSPFGPHDSREGSPDNRARQRGCLIRPKLSIQGVGPRERSPSNDNPPGPRRPLAEQKDDPWRGEAKLQFRTVEQEDAQSEGDSVRILARGRLVLDAYFPGTGCQRPFAEPRNPCNSTHPR